MHGLDAGGTPSPGTYITPSPGGRPSAPPPPPAPKPGGAGAAARPAWPANSPAPLPVGTGGFSLGLTSGPAAPQRKFMDEGKLRKVSGKLFAEPASVLKQLRWQGGGDGAGPASSSAGATSDSGGGGGSLAGMVALPGVPGGQRSQEGQQQALPLLHALGVGFHLLSMYRCGPGWLCRVVVTASMP